MIVFTCISFFSSRTKKLSSCLLVLRDVYKSYEDRGPGLTQKNFQEPGHETRVRGRQDVSSKDGPMRVWSVATGAPTEELDPGSFAFSKGSSSEHTVGKYSIAFKDDLLLISEDQSVVAFFRAPHVISTIETTGERIGVGCKNGEVLQLRVHWLV